MLSNTDYTETLDRILARERPATSRTRLHLRAPFTRASPQSSGRSFTLLLLSSHPIFSLPFSLALKRLVGSRSKRLIRQDAALNISLIYYRCGILLNSVSPFSRSELSLNLSLSLHLSILFFFSHSLSLTSSVFVRTGR